MSSSFVFMGTGGSMGIPVVGCSCHVCTSAIEENQRLRSAGLISIGKKTILLDCGPDFRFQALKYGIRDIDMLYLTHHHYDHTAGLDELRPLYMHHGRPVVCYTNKRTLDDVQYRFPYMFKPPVQKDVLVPQLRFSLLEEERGTFVHEGIDFSYCTYEQPGASVLGLRIGNFAYLTDIKTYHESIFAFLEDVEVLVLSALRYTPSPMHLSVDEAVDFSKRAGAKQTYLTHIAHELEHSQLCAYLPKNIRPAFDGLEVNFHL